MKKYELCIIIPCYNEVDRISITKYISFLKKNADTLICFVDDGSSDQTKNSLSEIKKQYQDNVTIVFHPNNRGKAETIRTGILYCNKVYDYLYIAYIDADLAVSLDECKSLTKYMQDDIIFCFGSRIRKVGSKIERRFPRFLISRIIATVISNMLKLGVYDTQCGCKIFPKSISLKIFQEQFLSKWLFDVEIFFRIFELLGRGKAEKGMLEIPLSNWTDVGKSKIQMSYGLYIFIDLIRINNRYK